jgi:predicted phage terminase large subunit-like protein
LELEKLTPELIHGFSERFLKRSYDDAVVTPDCHLEWWSLMCSDEPKVAIAAPRGHAKSTSVTFCFLLAAMLFRFRSYAIIVSETLSQSKEFLANVKRELQDNDDLCTLFGVKEFVIDNQETVVVKLVGMDNKPYEFRISCKGSEQALRGMLWRGKRPDLIIGDDLEGDEQVENEERRVKFRLWVYKALLPMGAPRKCIFRFVGTVLHFDSLLYRLMPDANDPDTTNEPLKMYSSKKRAGWKSVLYRAHPDASDFSQMLWPEMWSEEKLRGERDSYITQGMPEGYACEYLNNPMAVSDAFFTKEDLLPLDEDTVGPWNYYVGIDLAISEKNKRAYTVMTTVRINSNSQVQVVEVRRYRGDALEHLNNIFEIQMKFKPDCFFCEQENIARTLTPLLYAEMDIRKIYPNIYFFPVTKDKHSRARPMQARAKANTIEFDTEKHWWPELQNELLQFPRSPYSDQVDSISAIFLGIDQVSEAPTEDELEEEKYQDELEEYGIYETGRCTGTGY